MDRYVASKILNKLVSFYVIGIGLVLIIGLMTSNFFSIIEEQPIPEDLAGIIIFSFVIGLFALRGSRDLESGIRELERDIEGPKKYQTNFKISLSLLFVIWSSLLIYVLLGEALLG